jgi:hypothetical protein
MSGSLLFYQRLKEISEKVNIFINVNYHYGIFLTKKSVNGHNVQVGSGSRIQDYGSRSVRTTQGTDPKHWMELCIQHAAERSGGNSWTHAFSQPILSISYSFHLHRPFF